MNSFCWRISFCKVVHFAVICCKALSLSINVALCS
uniref:Uncharacterized protein n=1 Tax=Anguilla anguilla TaxID=7936 RepID=A0A0E9PI39_ANGAN